MKSPNHKNKSLDGYWKKRAYVLEDYQYDGFARGSRVLDVGCGFGEQLKSVISKGYNGIGVDISIEYLIGCRNKYLPVIQGISEQLPFRNNSFDGIICKVVLPYTDEKKVMTEISRILRPGAKVELCVHGVGYYIHYMLFAPIFFTRIYAVLTIINTWLYIIIGRRWRDTIYQSHSRMKRYFKYLHFEIEKITPSKLFLGMPVFIYYRLKKMNH
ncbi:MAG: class I SAM-dependent methyltransferase [Nitrospirota bacterium]